MLCETLGFCTYTGITYPKLESSCEMVQVVSLLEVGGSSSTMMMSIACRVSQGYF